MKMDLIKKQVEDGKSSGFVVDSEGNLWFQGRLCVPENDELKQIILWEAHCSSFSMHPGIGESRTSSSIGIVTTYNNTQMEVGEDYNGFFDKIVRLLGVLKSIISDRDLRLTSRFWEKLHEALGTRKKFSTAFHPQTDGQSEQVIHILENMLRICSLNLKEVEKDIFHS
ncbi:reverse transcriptase [Gossypium australe]|uniref:Reverse transcriptase n=1 Tax=Gossypium australe TaxID=47621 RepID=A0A5B6W9F8_9ROSI|nr:reverse transcriptase [Gossypium australe]